MDANNTNQIINIDLLAEKVADILEKRKPKEPVQMEGGTKFAAEVLNYKPATVYQKINEIPHSKKGGRNWFKREELEQYLEDRGFY